MINYTGRRGYYSSQPFINSGNVDTVYAGLNAMLDPEGWRTFKGWQTTNEDRAASTYFKTGSTTINTGNLVLAAGATAINDFRRRQHLLVDGNLHVIKRIIDDLNVEVVPNFTATASGLTIKRCFTLNALATDRATQHAGNSILFRNAMIFTIGDGNLYKRGAALNANLAATDRLAIGYPKPDGTYDSRPAGFTDGPDPVGSLEGAAGTKGMPTGAYPIVLIRKRSGFSGYGNPSNRVIVVVATAGNRIDVPLPAFDAAQGQNAWIIASCKTTDLQIANPSLWHVLETTTQSATVNVEWYDDDLVTQVTFNNYPPPKATCCFSFGNYLVLGGVGGPVDAGGVETTGGCELAPAKYNNPEAFDPFSRVPVANGEEIFGAVVGQLVTFILTPNTIQVVSLTGNQSAPMAVRGAISFPTVHQYNACFAKDRLYIATRGNLYRTMGEAQILAVAQTSEDLGSAASSDFAYPIRRDLKTIELAREFIMYDSTKDVVVVFHSNAQKGAGNGWQTKAWSLNLRDDSWNTPVILGDGTTDFTVTGVGRVGEYAYFITADGKTWQWDEGSGTVDGYIAFPFENSTPQFKKTYRYAKMTGNGSGSISAYTNLDRVNLLAGNSGYGPIMPLPAAGGASVDQPGMPLNVDASSLSLRRTFSLPAGDPIMDQISLDYIVHQGYRG